VKPIMVVPLLLGVSLSISILGWLYRKLLPQNVQEGIPRAIARAIGVAIGFRLLEMSRIFIRQKEPIGYSLALLALGIYVLYSLLSFPFQYEQKEEMRKRLLLLVDTLESRSELQKQNEELTKALEECLASRENTST
jgi:uncharacterized membrane protein YfcA